MGRGRKTADRKRSIRGCSTNGGVTPTMEVEEAYPMMLCFLRAPSKEKTPK